MELHTENTGTTIIDESGWAFFQPTNFILIDIAPPAILEQIRPTEGGKPWHQKIGDAIFSDAHRIELCETDTVIVLEALENPPEPTPDLIAAFRKYHSE